MYTDYYSRIDILVIIDYNGLPIQYEVVSRWNTSTSMHRRDIACSVQAAHRYKVKSCIKVYPKPSPTITIR